MPIRRGQIEAAGARWITPGRRGWPRSLRSSRRAAVSTSLDTSPASATAACPRRCWSILDARAEPLIVDGGRHVRSVQFVAVDRIRFYHAEHAAERLKAGRSGYFDVPALDLVEEVNDYSEIGILSWFPELQAFGCCDPEHQEVHVFVGVSWKTLLASPKVYFDAQWRPRREANVLPLHEACVPDDRFEVKESR